MNNTSNASCRGKKGKILTKILHWYGFSLCFSSFPVLLNLLLKYLQLTNDDYWELVPPNELLIIVAGIAGESIGDLIHSKCLSEIAKSFLLASCCLAALLSVALYYALKYYNSDSELMRLSTVSISVVSCVR